MIIGLVGEKLAGKDVVAEYLEKKYGAFYIKYSTILDEILNILDLPVSRRNEIDLGAGLREAFKRSVLWGAVKKKVLESSADLKVIGSIRLEDEFESARSLGAKVLYVTAPIDLRYQRALVRREKTDDGQQTFEQFIAQEQEWTEAGIPELGKKADFRIENVGTVEELYGKIDEILSTVA